MNRRVLVIGGVVGLAALSYGTRGLFAPSFAGQELAPPDAHRLAMESAIVLVDIRRPEEWKATGSGQGAHRLDMRRNDFADRVLELAGGNPDAPIALICARGVRSARMSNRLSEAGFTSIIDVPEGMLGSSAGPGWLARGLPLDRS